jgi:superoxide dismutase, Fe-Mn family
LVKSHGAAAGRVALVFQPLQGKLVNVWLTAAHAANLSQALNSGVGGQVTGEEMLTLDIAAGTDVNQALAQIDWAVVYERYQHAVHAAGEAWGTTADELADTVLIDVRRAGVFDAAPTMLPHAQ